LAWPCCSQLVRPRSTPNSPISRPDIPIPPALPIAASSVTFSFSLDSGTLGASANPDSQDGITAVKLHRLVFAAKGGINDLSFIQTLHALACVPINKTTTQSSRQVEIADYQRTVNTASGATFEVPLPEPVDLLPLLRPTKSEPRRIVVIVNLGGAMPTSEWKVDVLMSLSLRLRQ
jgi:hypothetical protein